MISVNIIVVLTDILLTLSIAVRCAEIKVYECPCNDSTCKDNNEKVNEPEIWKNFVYPASENINETENVKIGLMRNSAQVSCHPDTISENIVISFLDLYNEHGYDGELHGMLEDTNEPVSIQLTREGVLNLFKSAKGLEQFNTESFCIQRLNVSHSSVKICCGLAHKQCIRKCCPYGYVFSNNYSNPCIWENSSFTQGWTLPQLLPLSEATPEGGQDDQTKIRTGFPDCETIPSYNIAATLSTSLTKFQLPRQPFRVYRDGSVQYLGRETGSTKSRWIDKVSHVDYCVDTISVPAEMQDLTCGNDEQDVLIICSKPHVKNVTSNDSVWIYRIVYMGGFVLSIFFLLITAIVHFLLWEKQNIHAWTILCYVISLTGFYSCLLVIYAEETRKRLNPEQFTPFVSEGWCYALGLITHFMGIFAFSWLSVINFDLWWTFRVLKPMNQRSFDFKRLVCYASFATALPTTVVSVAVALQISHEKGSEPCRQTKEDNTIYPMYGQEVCFLANSAQPLYFYVPVGVLLLANLIFYLCTSCQMLRIYNATRRISDKNSRKQKQSCELFFKLFLVMGTTWIFQLILALVENDETASIWYFILFRILDLTNMFQAIAIFVIFVCKRETLRALEQKYFCLKSCLHPFRGVYRTPTIISRSTDGSTKMSRTEFTKHHSIESYSSNGGASDHRRDSELTIFS